LHRCLGRSPTTCELAEQLELGEEEVLEALAVVSSRWEVSLDQPAGGDADGRLGDLVAEPQAGEEPEDLLALPGLVARLPELEREVIVLGFFQDLDQYEIAARVGFSQMHVSRLQRRALARTVPLGGGRQAEPVPLLAELRICLVYFAQQLDEAQSRGNVHAHPPAGLRSPELLPERRP
jgi:hypothetical protein